MIVWRRMPSRACWRRAPRQRRPLAPREEERVARQATTLKTCVRAALRASPDRCEFPQTKEQCVLIAFGGLFQAASLISGAPAFAGAPFRLSLLVPLTCGPPSS